MARYVRLLVTVGMVLGACHSPVHLGKDGAASDGRGTPAPLDAATPAVPDAPSPVLPDAPAPALPDAGVRGRGVVPVTVSAGYSSTCAVFSDGSVKCWGRNTYGQLGNGTNTDSAFPVFVQGLDNVIALSASHGHHACAVRTDRTVVCWGDDYNGALGDGSDVNSASIKTVLNLSNAVDISTGAGSCATLLDQTARCWGSLPGGGASYRAVPIPLGGVASIQVGGSVVCALLVDGTVRCWGDNTSGQIGNGKIGEFTEPVRTPTEVTGLGQVIALSTGSSTVCAVLPDHTAVCWGANTRGQLGNGSVDAGLRSASALPVPVSGLGNVVAISVSGEYACALLADGTVRCWGSNESGTLGNGAEADSATPVPVSGLTDIVAITAGGDHACALAGDGTIKCWGSNDGNQLSHPDTHDTCRWAPCSRIPVRVEWKTTFDGGSDFPPPPDGATDLPPSPDGVQLCRISSDCAGQGGTFCQKDSCDPSALGVCTLIPGTRYTGFCTQEGDTVCGCDGRNYSTPCLAHAHVVNIASYAACPLPDAGAACVSNANCESRFYCKKATCTAVIGECTARPDPGVCYDQLSRGDAGLQRLCGCDHFTYHSECLAAADGSNVDFAGDCPPLP